MSYGGLFMKSDVDIRLLIKENYSEMPENFRRVADYIVDHYNEIVLLSINELAKNIGVSNTMIIRFAKHLGFNGYSEMRSNFKKEAYNSNFFVPLANMNEQKHKEKYAREYMESVAMNLRSFVDVIDYDSVDAAVTKLLGAKTIYIGGLGIDSSIANFLHINLIQMGFHPVLVTEEGYAMRRKLMTITDKDVLIMSFYPQTCRDEKVMANIAKEHGATLITNTDSESKAMLFGSDINFTTPASTVFFNSYVMAMALCELFLIKIYERRPDRVNKGLLNYSKTMSEENDPS